jgi:hypothetical protein
MTIDQRQSEIVQSTVSIVTEPLSRIGSRLDDLKSRVSGYYDRLAAVQNSLEIFRTSIERWLTYTAIILTVILFWFVFSQVALFIMSWRIYSGEGLLATITAKTQTGEDTLEEDETNGVGRV